MREESIAQYEYAKEPSPEELATALAIAERASALAKTYLANKFPVMLFTSATSILRKNGYETDDPVRRTKSLYRPTPGDVHSFGGYLEHVEYAMYDEKTRRVLCLALSQLDATTFEKVVKTIGYKLFDKAKRFPLYEDYELVRLASTTISLLNDYMFNMYLWNHQTVRYPSYIKTSDYHPGDLFCSNGGPRYEYVNSLISELLKKEHAYISPYYRRAEEREERDRQERINMLMRRVKENPHMLDGLYGLNTVYYKQLFRRQGRKLY